MFDGHRLRDRQGLGVQVHLDDYPHNIGVISGVVGLAGGMGGFILPIMFGALVDLTGVRSSAFMLMFGIVWVSLMWMYFTEVRPLAARAASIRTCAFRRPTNLGLHEHQLPRRG